MGKPSPRYTPEFKQRAVELYLASGPDATYTEVARGLGCDAGTLSKWVSLARNDQPDDPEANPFRYRRRTAGSGARTSASRPRTRSF